MSQLTSRRTNRRRTRNPCSNGNKGISLARNGATATLAQLQGFTQQQPDGGHFTVFAEDGLGDDGVKVAQGVLAQCEVDYNQLVEIFGGPRPPHFTVLITDEPDASHSSCDDPTLSCGSSGANAGFTNRLVVMEEVEVFAALQGKGWNCLQSNGEALSRVLGEQLHPPQSEDFITAPLWLDGIRKDFVTENDLTDLNPQAIGCAALFLYYLRYQLRFSWQEIVQTGGDTLADVYKQLTGKDDALKSFRALMQVHFPQGLPCGLKTNNPFPLPCKP